MSPWKLEMVRLVDAVTARWCATHFHAVADAVKDSAVRRMKIKEDRVTVIHRGRDPDSFGKPSLQRRALVRRQLGIPPTVPILLNVGRQEYQKGHEVLLDAFAEVAEDHDEVQLLVAGRDGNCTAALSRKLGELAHRDRIRFLGHRDDVPDLLAASDLFVFPSHYEGIGGAVIEAMAMELPVVASDLPGVREVVEPGASAELVSPRDPRQLASAIGALIENPDLRTKMGQRGRQIFLDRFTLDRCADRTAELYREVASRGGN